MVSEAGTSDEAVKTAAGSVRAKIFWKALLAIM
jgi:hypothetical protein